MYKANEIRLGESVQGLFQAMNDTDWYKLVIDKPGKNIVRVDLSGVPDVNSFLFIHDSEGYEVMRSDTRGQGEPEEIINFGVTQGVYYISMSANEVNENEDYSLSTDLVSPWEEGMEFEFNDNIYNANEMKLDSVIEGYIQPRNDRDYFLIAVPEPGMDIFLLEMSSSTQANLDLE